MDLVRIDWFDAEGDGEWQEHADFSAWAEVAPMVVTTYGLLAFESEDHIVIVQSISENQIRSPFKIPKGCVKTLTRLETTNFKL